MEQLDIITFAEEFFILEDGNPICFESWQKGKILRPIFYDLEPGGERRINQALIGTPKKNGKSTLAGCVACFGLFADGETEPEVYSAASDKEQAKVVFNYVSKAIKRSPHLLRECKIYKDAIETKKGGIYRALSSDAPSIHGLNASMVIWDELWNQRSYDLWEALTHSPARKQPLHFSITYAGFEQVEGNLLWDLFQSGLKGKDPSFYMFWTHENPASWVTEKYLEQQKRRLPEHRYLRLHENRWTSGEYAFLTREDVEAAIDPTLEPTFGGVS